MRGNVNWMHARQSVLDSPLFGDDIKKLFPIIQPGRQRFGGASITRWNCWCMSGRSLAARDGDADSRSVGRRTRT